MDKRQFKKEMKAYEKRLEEREKQGALTFNEKEEYQSMLRNRERNKALRRERVHKVVGTAALVIGVMIAREIIYYVDMNTPGTAEAMAYQGDVVGGIQVEDDMSQEEKHLEFARLRQIWTEKTELLNTVDEACHSAKGFDTKCYEQLEELKATSEYESFEELITIHNAYDAQIKMYFRALEEGNLDQDTLKAINHQMGLITMSYNKEAVRLSE